MQSLSKQKEYIYMCVGRPTSLGRTGNVIFVAGSVTHDG